MKGRGCDLVWLGAENLISLENLGESDGGSVPAKRCRRPHAVVIQSAVKPSRIGPQRRIYRLTDELGPAGPQL